MELANEKNRGSYQTKHRARNPHKSKWLNDFQQNVIQSQNISNNIVKIKELQKSPVCAIFAHAGTDEKTYKTNCYNLEPSILKEKKIVYRRMSPKAGRTP